MSHSFGSLSSSIRSADLPTQGLTNMAHKIRSSLSNKGRPHLRIVLDDVDESQVASYSTMDKIQGRVIIACSTTTIIERLAIDFQGIAKAYVERVTTSTAMSGKQEARHNFLKLVQPIPESAWPENKVFIANREYEFPFIFVVPHQLLPRVCRHAVASSTVHQEHLKLPPSFGDKAIAGHGHQRLDDGAPDMARITYSIIAKVSECDSNDCNPIVAEKMVRVLPAVEEHPPFDTESPESDYTLRTEKDVKKGGIFSSKAGRLVVETPQPRAMCIPSLDGETPESQLVTLQLRFDPAEKQGKPPKLGSLSTKLRIATFFASSARMKLATRHDAKWDLNQGLHTEQITLASRNVTSVEWSWNEESEANSEARRGSIASSSLSDSLLIPEPSKKYKGQGFWTASIVAPVSLPSNRAWVPTFHSCLISRIYGLGVHLGLASGSVTGMDLKLPLQLISHGSDASNLSQSASLTAQEHALEAMEADEFFAPRTISPMPNGFVGGSSIGQSLGRGADSPPDYEPFPRVNQRAAIAT